jgi:hypothetical protein
VGFQRFYSRISDRDSDDSVSASQAPKFWLMKSEPDEYSIDDLEQSPNSTGFWDVSQVDTVHIIFLCSFIHATLKYKISSPLFNETLIEVSTDLQGVRNFQARNNLMRMVPGENILFYHR